MVRGRGGGEKKAFPYVVTPYIPRNYIRIIIAVKMTLVLYILVWMLMCPWAIWCPNKPCEKSACSLRQYLNQDYLPFNNVLGTTVH